MKKEDLAERIASFIMDVDFADNKLLILDKLGTINSFIKIDDLKSENRELVVVALAFYYSSKYSKEELEQIMIDWEV